LAASVLAFKQLKYYSVQLSKIQHILPIFHMWANKWHFVKYRTYKCLVDVHNRMLVRRLRNICSNVHVQRTTCCSNCHMKSIMIKLDCRNTTVTATRYIHSVLKCQSCQKIYLNMQLCIQFKQTFKHSYNYYTTIHNLFAHDTKRQSFWQKHEGSGVHLRFGLLMSAVIWVSRVSSCSMWHIIRHFGVVSFQAINCTSTDKYSNEEKTRC